jgi:hypothetical protein
MVRVRGVGWFRAEIIDESIAVLPTDVMDDRYFIRLGNGLSPLSIEALGHHSGLSWTEKPFCSWAFAHSSAFLKESTRQPNSMKAQASRTVNLLHQRVVA